MPDAFTSDPRTDVAVAAVVASNNSVGYLAGATANIPLTQIMDAAGAPPGAVKQQTMPIPTAANPTPAPFTTAYCPVEKKIVYKLGTSDRTEARKLPTRCPSCGYEKLQYS